MNDTKLELLAPAGSFLKMKVAFAYGADSVYIGGESFSLRAKASNFSIKNIVNAIELAHKIKKKIYLAANIFAHNNDIKEYKIFLNEFKNIAIDAIIISDLGMFEVTKNIMPNVDIHVSTQANVLNYETANFWHKMGAKRIILARELSFDEIAKIRKNTPDELELEAFIHGAMCISYSGRCYLSKYTTKRDSNSGNCAQPCRWKYFLKEESRKDKEMEIQTDDKGSYILNSKDLCIIERLPELIKCGVRHFKIEGRMKSEYYVATTTKIYKDALDEYQKSPNDYKTNEKWKTELEKISHREYTTGFYLDQEDDERERSNSGGYITNYDLLGFVIGYDSNKHEIEIIQKNRIVLGDVVEIICPFVPGFSIYKINNMKNQTGEEIEVANVPEEIIKIKVDKPYPIYSMIRKIRAK